MSVDVRKLRLVPFIQFENGSFAMLSSLMDHTTFLRSRQRISNDYKINCANSAGLLNLFYVGDGKDLIASGFENTFLDVGEVRVTGGHHNGFVAIASHRSEEHTSELQSRFDLVCR